jgi:putative inorganic carbon (HCO3(-)) transporter
MSLLVLVILAGVGAGARITRHAGSITASQDASNLERVNRWMAAVEMARDRPWLGVGYAVYPLAYPEYRRKTIITELAYQHMGPHSEPMRLISETGLLGTMAALWFMGAAFVLGVRVVRRSPDPREKLLSLALVAGLITYVIHSVFRTYLDLEKVVVPFWASLGLLAALGRGLDAAPPRPTMGP